MILLVIFGSRIERSEIDKAELEIKTGRDDEQLSYYRCQAWTRARVSSSLSHLTLLLRAT